MSEFETGLPSIRQVQAYIKDKQEIEIKVITGDVLAGKVFWQDQNCICLLDPDNQQVIIWRNAMVFLKPRNS